MANDKKTFWNETTLDPKRSNRWVLVMNNIKTWTVKTSAKPSFTINNIPHSFMSHTFYYPGRITWNTLQITLVDPVIPDASAIILKTLQASGYALPGKETDAMISLSKQAAVDALGKVQIQQVDTLGRPVDEWSLVNAWIEAANFGDLSYETDAMVNVQLTLRYDWAEYRGERVPGSTQLLDTLKTGDEQIDKVLEYQQELFAAGTTDG